jgi:hypothetical protein
MNSNSNLSDPGGRPLLILVFMGVGHGFAGFSAMPPGHSAAAGPGWADTHLLEHLSNSEWGSRYNLINMNESL